MSSSTLAMYRSRSTASARLIPGSGLRLRGVHDITPSRVESRHPRRQLVEGAACQLKRPFGGRAPFDVRFSTGADRDGLARSEPVAHVPRAEVHAGDAVRFTAPPVVEVIPVVVELEPCALDE